jgi:hypothetical protein
LAIGRVLPELSQWSMLTIALIAMASMVVIAAEQAEISPPGFCRLH